MLTSAQPATCLAHPHLLLAVRQGIDLRECKGQCVMMPLHHHQRESNLLLNKAHTYPCAVCMSGHAHVLTHALFQQVVNMLQADAWGFQSHAATSSRTPPAAPRRHRSAAVFHICDAPNHGTSFNSYSDAGSSDLDYYPHGPLTPAPNAVVPSGRVQNWDEEAARLLCALKADLNVISYTMAQLRPQSTKRMVTAFKAIVGDPVPVDSDDEDSCSQQQRKQQQVEEASWITTMDFQEQGAVDINNKVCAHPCTGLVASPSTSHNAVSSAHHPDGCLCNHLI